MPWVNFKHQKSAVGILRRSLERERLAHAYLLVSEDITEAEALARELAAAVNCDKGGDESCGKCATCEKIKSGNHPDVRWIRPEMKSRQIGIETIRELEQPLYLAAGEGRTKVAIVVDAERLTTQAANAFLKTLEEPPADSLILLLTTAPQRLLETILSRCLRIMLAAGEATELTPRQKEALNQFVKLLETKENTTTQTYQFLGWLMAQLKEMREETEATVEGRWQLKRYAESNPEWVKDQEEGIAAAVEAEYRAARGFVLVALKRWLRDVMLCAEGADENLLAFATQVTRARKQASCGSAVARGRLEAWEELQESLTRNVNETVALEVALLKLNSPSMLTGANL